MLQASYLFCFASAIGVPMSQQHDHQPEFVPLADFKKDQREWVKKSMITPIIVVDQAGNALFEMEVVREPEEQPAAAE